MQSSRLNQLQPFSSAISLSTSSSDSHNTTIIREAPIRITRPLLDSYLGVFCKRPSYSKSPELAFSVYEHEYTRWGIPPGGLTYQLMLRLVTKSVRVSREQRLDIWKAYLSWDENLESRLISEGKKLDKFEKEAIRVKQGRGKEAMFQGFVLMIQGHARWV